MAVRKWRSRTELACTRRETTLVLRRLLVAALQYAPINGRVFEISNGAVPLRRQLGGVINRFIRIARLYLVIWPTGR